MQNEMFDLQDVTVALDREDKELMSMFPRNRECVLDDMVLVRRGDRQYLERKSDIARRRKMIRTTLECVVTLAVPVCLVSAIYAATVGTGNPWGWWGGSIICTLLRLFKIPAEVKCS